MLSRRSGVTAPARCPIHALFSHRAQLGRRTLKVLPASLPSCLPLLAFMIFTASTRRYTSVPVTPPSAGPPPWQRAFCTFSESAPRRRSGAPATTVTDEHMEEQPPVSPRKYELEGLNARHAARSPSITSPNQ